MRNRFFRSQSRWIVFVAVASLFAAPLSAHAAASKQGNAEKKPAPRFSHADCSEGRVCFWKNSVYDDTSAYGWVNCTAAEGLGWEDLPLPHGTLQDFEMSSFRNHCTDHDVEWSEHAASGGHGGAADHCMNEWETQGPDPSEDSYVGDANNDTMQSYKVYGPNHC